MKDSELYQIAIDGWGLALSAGMIYKNYDLQRRAAFTLEKLKELKPVSFCGWEDCDQDATWTCPDGTGRCDYHAAVTALGELNEEESNLAYQCAWPEK